MFNADLIRARLGLTLEELTSRTAQRLGVNPSDGFMITGVQSDSQAASAKLRSGFLVTAIDGQMPSDLTQAAKLLYAKKRDERVQLDIAIPQRVGAFSVLQPATVDLNVR
jgi:S1-C subfamily serine protease